MLRRALAFAVRGPRAVARSVRAARGRAGIPASSELETTAVGALACRSPPARATATARPESSGPGKRLANGELRRLTRGHLALRPRQRRADQRPVHGTVDFVDRFGCRGGLFGLVRRCRREIGLGVRFLRRRGLALTVRTRKSACGGSRQEPPGRARLAPPSSFAVAAPWLACIRVRCRRLCSGSASRPVRPWRQWRDW